MANKLFLTTLNGKKSKQTPIWIMRQAGRHLKEYRAVRAVETDFISFCLNPEQASTVTLQPITRYKLDAASYARFGGNGFIGKLSQFIRSVSDPKRTEVICRWPIRNF